MLDGMRNGEAGYRLAAERRTLPLRSRLLDAIRITGEGFAGGSVGRVLIDGEEGSFRNVLS